MPEKRIKVVIDTNIWISYLLTNSFHQLDEMIFFDKIILNISDELIKEIIDVLRKPKFKKIINNDDILVLLDLFQRKANHIIVTSNIKICRDIKDNFLLNLAIDSNADFLITGDKDLLNLNIIENTKILTINEFFTIFKM